MKGGCWRSSCVRTWRFFIVLLHDIFWDRPTRFQKGSKIIILIVLMSQLREGKTCPLADYVLSHQWATSSTACQVTENMMRKWHSVKAKGILYAKRLQTAVWKIILRPFIMFGRSLRSETITIAHIQTKSEGSVWVSFFYMFYMTLAQETAVHCTLLLTTRAAPIQTRRSDGCAVASKSRITMMSIATVFSNMIVRWQPLSICETYDDVTAYKSSLHQLASRVSYILRTRS